MGWEFAAYLVVAMLLGVALAALQQRHYTGELRRIAELHDSPNKMLVSGRSKGRLRGAVVILVVDVPTRKIVEARMMMGATSFARFRDASELLGPVRGVGERARNSKVAEAAEQAIAQLKK